MSNERQQKKHHIRAAREWLGKAENSLDQQDDLQGELKLMLAKAELSQLEESAKTQRWRRRMLRVLALVTALAIAAIGLYVVPGFLTQDAPVDSGIEQSDVQTPASSALTQNARETEAATMPPAATEEASVTTDSAANEPNAREEQASREATVTPSQPATVPQETQTVPQTEKASAPKTEAAAPPNLEKQQLMQSAGKVLRQ